MRRQPGERDGDDNYRDENPAAGGIFPLPDSETAASGKGVSDRAGKGQNDYAGARRIGKERCPIAPAPNDERKQRQCAADYESEILNRVNGMFDVRCVRFDGMAKEMLKEVSEPGYWREDTGQAIGPSRERHPTRNL